MEKHHENNMWFMIIFSLSLTITQEFHRIADDCQYFLPCEIDACLPRCQQCMSLTQGVTYVTVCSEMVDGVAYVQGTQKSWQDTSGGAYFTNVCINELFHCHKMGKMIAGGENLATKSLFFYTNETKFHSYSIFNLHCENCKIGSGHCH